MARWGQKWVAKLPIVPASELFLRSLGRGKLIFKNWGGGKPRKAPYS